MNINRHNYETFFLLYVDNELSATERKAVEIFVQENADLQIELKMLLETTLPDENIYYGLRNDLYKNEMSEDLLSENLLLYLDNELDAVDSKNMESKISGESNIKKEWEILQQTKLDARDRVIFKDKKLLYRHEKGRVISIRLWRVAAAAAIIIGILFTSISILKKDEPGKNNLVENNIRPTLENQTGSNKNSLNVVPEDGAENITSTPGKQKAQVVPSDIKGSKVADEKINIIAGNNQLVKQDNNVAETPLEKINKEAGNEMYTANVLNKRSEIVYVNKSPVEVADLIITGKIKAPPAPVIDYNEVTAMPDSYATTTAFNDAPENNNQILYMNEKRITRSKAGGLFRKVKRVVERNTHIKTDDGFKIGGFAIALK